MFLSRTLVSSTAAFHLCWALAASLGNKPVNVGIAAATEHNLVREYCDKAPGSRLYLEFPDEACDNGNCKEIAEALAPCVLKNVDLFLVDGSLSENGVRINKYLSGEAIRGVKFKGIAFDAFSGHYNTNIEKIFEANHQPRPIITAINPDNSNFKSFLKKVDEILIFDKKQIGLSWYRELLDETNHDEPFKVFVVPDIISGKSDGSLAEYLQTAGVVSHIGFMRNVKKRFDILAPGPPEKTELEVPASEPKGNVDVLATSSKSQSLSGEVEEKPASALYPTGKSEEKPAIAAGSADKSEEKPAIAAGPADKSEEKPAIATGPIDKSEEKPVTFPASIQLDGPTEENLRFANSTTSVDSFASVRITIPIHTSTVTETHTTTISSQSCNGNSSCELTTATATFVVKVELCVSVPTNCVVCQPKETKVFECLEGDCPQSKVSPVTRDFGTPITRVGRSAVAGEGWTVAAQPTESAPIKTITLTACEKQVCRSTAIPLLIESSAAPVVQDDDLDHISDKLGQPHHPPARNSDAAVPRSSAEIRPTRSAGFTVPTTQMSEPKLGSQSGVASQPIKPSETFEGIAVRSSFSILAVCAFFIALV